MLRLNRYKVISVICDMIKDDSFITPEMSYESNAIFEIWLNDRKHIIMTKKNRIVILTKLYDKWNQFNYDFNYVYHDDRCIYLFDKDKGIWSWDPSLLCINVDVLKCGAITIDQSGVLHSTLYINPFYGGGDVFYINMTDIKVCKINDKILIHINLNNCWKTLDESLSNTEIECHRLIKEKDHYNLLGTNLKLPLIEITQHMTSVYHYEYLFLNDHSDPEKNLCFGAIDISNLYLLANNIKEQLFIFILAFKRIKGLDKHFNYYIPKYMLMNIILLIQK